MKMMHHYVLVKKLKITGKKFLTMVFIQISQINLIIQHGYGEIVIIIVKNVEKKEMMKTINAIFVETISISIGIKPKEMV